MKQAIAYVLAAILLSAASCDTSEPPTVQPGAFCDTEGDVGRTENGTEMECKGPGELRWRRR